MPITSVEQSGFIAQQQKFMYDLRVGQFAKFLNKNPIYVTYYPVNNAESRTDAGTGSAYEMIGPHSPVRFNKINNLPTFNIPEIKPDVIMDEGGYDIEADISDIAFIPGTVRPKPGDHMLVTLEGVRPLLYICTNFRHNSVQSNDYYFGDFSLVDVDQNYIEEIEKQVTEVYNCQFDNIGTNNKVFFTEAESAELVDAKDIIDTLTHFYQEAFYSTDADGFILFNGNQFGTQWYYDNWLTRFINESEIFVDENSDTTVSLPYLELRDLNFDSSYKRSVWYAVLKRSNDYISPYVYAWNTFVQNRTSPLNLGNFPTLVPNLHVAQRYISPTEKMTDELRKKLNYYPGARCGWDGLDTDFRHYFSYELQTGIKENKAPGNLNYVEKMIFDYISKGTSGVEIDKKALIEQSFRRDLFTYMHMPIVIYILKQVLQSKTAKS